MNHHCGAPVADEHGHPVPCTNTLPCIEHPYQVEPAGIHEYAWRGSEIEAWIKTWRDRHAGLTVDALIGKGAWAAIDDMLDDYRLHADTAVPICFDVHEGDIGG